MSKHVPFLQLEYWRTKRLNNLENVEEVGSIS